MAGKLGRRVAALTQALIDTLAAVNWPSALFPVLIAIAVAYLLKMDADPSSKFKIVQFITNPDGTGNSASLAYCVVLLVMTWVFWAQVTWHELSSGFATVYAGTFVAGSVFRAAISAKERTAALNADRPIAEPQSDTTTTTERVDP